MNNAVIHIGYPRTATSWLQKEFFPKVKNYEFVHLGNIIFGNETLKNYPKNLIGSSEEIINIRLRHKKYKNPCDIKQNINFYLKYNKVVFFVFVRRQIDIISSAYSYYINTQKNVSFEEYIKWSKCCTDENKKWKYYSHLKEFENCFNTNLKVFVYEQFKEEPRKFIETLSKELGFEVDFDKIKYHKKINESKGHITNKAINALNFFFKKIISPENYFLPNIGNKFVMPNEYQEYVFSYFAEENQLLDKKYNLSLKKYGYY